MQEEGINNFFLINFFLEKNLNKKTVVAFLLSTFIILVGVPESFARPQYITNLTTVYGAGSCNTCHIIAPGSGMRNFNRTSGIDNSNRTFPRNSYGTLFESQPGHATDPGAALMTIGSPPATSPEDTPDTQAGTQAAPGFEIVAAFVGLVACALVARRHNK